MGKASKIVKCVDCGGEFSRKELNRHSRCRDCAWVAMREAMEQMYYHSGPYYEKWKARMKAATRRL